MAEFILRKPNVALDIECGPNHFHCGFKSMSNKKLIQIETPLGENGKLDKDEILRFKKLLTSYTLINFNGVKYDMTMCKAALKGKTNSEMYEISQQIISKNLQPWVADKQFDLGFLKVTQIDLIELSPGVASLKKYGARMHSQKLQDLPYAFDKHLTFEENEFNKQYNENDLDTTIDLHHALRTEIDIRYAMSDKYKTDLMSKGGAQIAETVILHELAKKDVAIQKFKVPKDYVMKYKPPECLAYTLPHLKDFLNGIIDEDFKLSKGKVILPKWMTTPVDIHGFKVKCGIGGLHSQEKSLVAVADDEYVIKNCDVGSYYPNLMMAYGYYPKNIGKVFLSVFSTIYHDRMKHKRAGNKIESDSLKLVLNSAFGKLGNNYSKLFAPELMIHVTISGQLLLMMLIEWLREAGIEVLSTNTDGIEYKVHRSREQEIVDLIEEWSELTKQPMEHGSYQLLAASSVNDYVAVYDDGPKAKGRYGEPTLKKDAVHQIVYRAIRDYLSYNKPLEETIRNCKDVREFISCKAATGGAEWENPITGEVVYLGKVVRYYYSRSNGNPIIKIKPNVKGSYAKVATTDYAVPIMDLPEGNKIPYDLDIPYYIGIAIRQLDELGICYINDENPLFPD